MDFAKVATLVFLSALVMCTMSQKNNDDASQQIQKRIIDAPGDLTQAQCEQIYKQIAPPSGKDDSGLISYICQGLLQQREAKKNPPKPDAPADEE